MKVKIIGLGLLVMALGSCEKESKTEDNNPPADPYFVSAKIDGETMETRGNDNNICKSNQGVCFSTGSVFDKDEMDFSINNSFAPGFSIASLMAREGDTLKFTNNLSLYAELEWDIDQVSYNTADTALQMQSYLYIQEVDKTDSVEGWGESAHVRGSFACTLKEESGSDTKSVTDGSFYIRVYESY